MKIDSSHKAPFVNNLFSILPFKHWAFCVKHAPAKNRTSVVIILFNFFPSIIKIQVIQNFHEFIRRYKETSLYFPFSYESSASCSLNIFGLEPFRYYISKLVMIFREIFCHHMKVRVRRLIFLSISMKETELMTDLKSSPSITKELRIYFLFL